MEFVDMKQRFTGLRRFLQECPEAFWNGPSFCMEAARDLVMTMPQQVLQIGFDQPKASLLSPLGPDRPPPFRLTSVSTFDTKPLELPNRQILPCFPRRQRCQKNWRWVVCSVVLPMPCRLAGYAFKSRTPLGKAKMPACDWTGCSCRTWLTFSSTCFHEPCLLPG